MDEIGIVTASEKDLDLVLGILSEAAEWLASKGLPTRWGLESSRKKKFEPKLPTAKCSSRSWVRRLPEQ